MAITFVNTAFENASPANWQIEPGGRVTVDLLYDHERGSPNRAAGHWHICLEGDPGTAATVCLRDFDNIWNGKPGSPISEKTGCYLSNDRRSWTRVPGRKTPANTLEVDVRLEADRLYLARLEPYRLGDLERLLAEIGGHPLVQVESIGATVGGRRLEVVRVGHADAPHAVLLRARAHPWEPGGNWCVQGLFRRLLRDDAEARRYLDRYVLYVMPMANKDGVVRGGTRFNVLGKDLNRDWDRPADPELCPENHALEQWLEATQRAGRTFGLALDFHNDQGGHLITGRPATGGAEQAAAMQRLERLLYDCTWFTEGRADSVFDAPSDISEGLQQRYGIPAALLELNCNWIKGLKKPPFGADWEQLGTQMAEVFWRYFPEP